MDEINWDILIKRNKIWTFINLIIFLWLFRFVLLLLERWDVDILLHPREDIWMFVIVVLVIILLLIFIPIFSLQLIRKWTITINENELIDNYSNNPWKIYQTKNIACINICWCMHARKSLNFWKKMIITYIKNRKASRSTIYLPLFTWVWINTENLEEKLAQYKIVFFDYTRKKYRTKDFIIYNLDERKKQQKI